MCRSEMKYLTSYRGYDDVLLGQGYRTPRGAVIDEYGAMVGWWSAGENRRTRRKTCSSATSLTTNVNMIQTETYKSHLVDKGKQHSTLIDLVKQILSMCLQAAGSGRTSCARGTCVGQRNERAKLRVGSRCARGTCVGQRNYKLCARYLRWAAKWQVVSEVPALGSEMNVRNCEWSHEVRQTDRQAGSL
jgi:hypothetical protein